jgi:hypothetical protein
LSEKLNAPLPKPDLIVSDLLSEYPPRRLIINVADIHAGRLTLLEALDIADASGIYADNFAEVMGGPDLKRKALLLYAMAWVIARRVEKDLTFDEVCTYKLEVVGKAADAESDVRRAEAVMSVAALANVSPAEAKEMTIAEISAMTKIRKRRARRRAG